MCRNALISFYPLKFSWSLSELPFTHLTKFLVSLIPLCTTETTDFWILVWTNSKPSLTARNSPWLEHLWLKCWHFHIIVSITKKAMIFMAYQILSSYTFWYRKFIWGPRLHERTFNGTVTKHKEFPLDQTSIHLDEELPSKFPTMNHLQRFFQISPHL